jgi:hypothetical protein
MAPPDVPTEAPGVVTPVLPPVAMPVLPDEVVLPGDLAMLVPPEVAAPAPPDVPTPVLPTPTLVPPDAPTPLEVPTPTCAWAAEATANVNASTMRVFFMDASPDDSLLRGRKSAGRRVITAGNGHRLRCH